MAIRKTLASVLSKIWRGADALRKVLHLLILLFIFSIVVSALSSTAPVVPGSAALVINPGGLLVEQLEGDPFERAVAELIGDAEPQTLVQDVVDAFNFARDDARIKAVVLDLSGMQGGGLSKLKRIGDAIDTFRESGKPVIATADYFGQGSYYLASRADEVYMHPEGILALSGFGAYLNYFRDAIDALRIDWNVFRVGKYKSAVEPYLRNDMSPDDREALTAIVDQLWTQYKNDIETARGIESGTVENVLANLVAETEAVDGDLAALALEFGFVDDLFTREQFRDRIVEITGPNGDDSAYPATSLDDYVQQMRVVSGDSAGEQNVAIIVAAGAILNGSHPPGTIGGDSTANLLREARNDDSVRAVVLRVDSPGGSSFASEVIRNEIEELRASGKPVVASMSSVAASGGYWISMAADRIYASPYTITGSIGIYGMFPTFQRSLDAIGITTDGIGTTAWAGQLRPDRAMSDEMKTMFQLSINEGYDDFISRVSMHRDMPEEEVHGIAQGRIWSGSDALEIGLVDTLGNLDEAVAGAAELADLEAGSYGIKRFEKQLSPGEQLMIDMMSRSGGIGASIASLFRPRPSLERVADLIDGALAPLTRFNDPKGIYAHCFCEFQQ